MKLISKSSLIINTLSILLIILSISIISCENEIIKDNTIYINNDKIFISATPHTLYESGNVTFIIETKSYTGDIDLIWGFNKATAKIKSIKHDKKEIKSMEKPENKIVNGNHLLYKDEKQKIKRNEQIKFIVYIDVNNFSSGKYDFMVKPSSMTIEEAKLNNQLYILDPWWDNTFKYRNILCFDNRLGGNVADMQVNMNISYIEGMQSDFDDLRFRYGNIIDLQYWIEDYNSSNWCNVWIKLTHVVGSAWNNDTILMYYGNAGVSNLSNMNNTFMQAHGYTINDFHFPNIGTDRFVVEAKVTQINTITPVFFGVDNNESVVDQIRFWLSNDALMRAVLANDGTGGSYVIPGSFIPTTKYKLIYDPVNVRWYCNNTLQFITGLNHPDEYMGLSFNNDGNGILHWMFMRKYVEHEPIGYINDQQALFLKYNLANNIINIVESDGTITVTGGLYSSWTAQAFNNNASIVITDYLNGVGLFELFDYPLKQFTVSNFTMGDLVYLSQENVFSKTGIIDNNGEYCFDSDIPIGEYELSIKSYNNITGVHGFIYEGTSASVVPLSEVVVYIFNSTWSDTTTSDNGGYYYFTNLTNTTYTLNFKKDRYKEVLYQYVTPANRSMYYKNIYMQKSTGDYYSRHYCTFILKNMFGGRYSGIQSIVYDNNMIIDNGETGFDGSVVFHLFEDVEYRITFIDTLQNVNEEIILMPRDDRYIIWIGENGFTPDNDTRLDHVNYWWIKNEINNTYSWLNFTYSDSDNKTTFIEYWINDTNNTNLYYTSQINPCIVGDYEINAMVNNSNHTYIVHFSANHPDYPNLQNSVVQTFTFYNKKLIDLLFSEQWQYTIVSLFILILIGTFFSGSNAAQGSLIIVLCAWFFSFIQWLPTSTMGYGAIVLATILSVSWNLRKSDIVHT